jgi:hypothetical protein
MEKENQLAENIQELTKQIQRANSPWKSLGRGILFGIGSVVGASIIAAIVLWALTGVVNSLKDIPRFFR